jgi:hypothetical protein
MNGDLKSICLDPFQEMHRFTSVRTIPLDYEYIAGNGLCTSGEIVGERCFGYLDPVPID